jgi:hypothetical protein
MTNTIRWPQTCHSVAKLAFAGRRRTGKKRRGETRVVAGLAGDRPLPLDAARPALRAVLSAADRRATIAAMPLKSIVMAVVLSGWLIAGVIAFMIVAYTSFFGIAVIGLMIWFVTARMDLEEDGAAAWGAGVSPGFFARQLQTRAEMSRAERAALRAERSLRAQSTRFFRNLGMALTLIGAAGFLYFQL